jgi:hypothetical protein
MPRCPLSLTEVNRTWRGMPNSVENDRPQVDMAIINLNDVIWTSDVSVRLDVCGSDHVAPLFGFFGDEFSKVSGRAGKHRRAQVAEAFLHR